MGTMNPAMIRPPNISINRGTAALIRSSRILRFVRAASSCADPISNLLVVTLTVRLLGNSLGWNVEVVLVAAVGGPGGVEFVALRDRVAVRRPVVAGLLGGGALHAGPARLGERDAEEVVNVLERAHGVPDQVLVLDVAQLPGRERAGLDQVDDV